MDKRKVSCILPHKHEKMEIPEVNSLMSTLKVICPAHGQYLLGLEERSIPVPPSWFLRKYQKNSQPKGNRYPALFAAQNWRSQEDCDNVVFKKGEIVICSASYALSKAPSLINRTIDLRDPNAVFINTPITKYLRYACVSNNIIPDYKSWQTNFVDFRQLQNSYVRESANVAVFDAVITYLTNMFYPYSKDINQEMSNELKENRYLKRIAITCKQSHVRQEQFKKSFHDYYSSFFDDDQEYKQWSGFNWTLVNAMDIPVGLDFNVASDISPGGCPTVDPNKGSQTNYHWYRYSMFIPNIEWVPKIGYRATRDIYDKEELVLEPNEDKYMQQTLWVYTHYGDRIPSDYQNYKSIEKLHRIPEPYTIPDLYTRQVLDTYQAHTRVL